MDILVEKQAVALMGELVCSLDVFNARWVERVVRCVVFPIALYPDGEVPDQIPVERESGAVAVGMASQAFARLTRLEMQHPVSVSRLPGYVILSDDPTEWVADVNRCKSALEQWIKQHWTAPTTRTRACRRMFPGCVMHQVYRHIHLVGDEIGRVSFLWSPSTVASKRLTLDEAIALVNDAKAATTGDGVDSTEHFDIAREQLLSIARGGSVQIVRRTPVAPHPRVALFEDGQGKASITHHANLPLVMQDRTDGRKIRELVSFDASNRQRPRGRPQHQLTPVFPPLHLYAINDSC